MKKFLKIILFVLILTIVASVNVFAHDNFNRENMANYRREQIEKRKEYVKKCVEEKRTQNISLLSAEDYLPDNLLSLKESYRYYDGDVLDIYFDEPSYDEWVSLVIIDDDGEYYSYCETENIYNDNGQMIGVTISRIDIYDDIAPGEYNAYIYSDSGYYEPFKYLYKGYYLYENHYNPKHDNIWISTDLYEILDIENIDSIDLKINDMSDKNIINIKNVNYDEYLDIYIKLPSDTQDGKYLLYFTINYNNGTSEDLMPSLIYIGDYFSINHIENLNEEINQHVKEVSIIAHTDTIIDKNKDKFTISLTDYEENIISKISEYELLSSSEYYSEIKFTLNIPDNLENDSYYFDIKYDGDKKFVDNDWYESVYMTDEEVVMSNGIRKNSEYIVMYTYGLDAGEYYVYEDDPEGTYIGTMKVDSSGYTQMFVEEDYGYFYYGYIYVHKKDEAKDKGVSFLVNIHYYNDNDDYPYMSKLSPKYIFEGTDSLKDFEIKIGHTRHIKKSDIKSVKFYYNGEVVSVGDNIRFINAYNSTTYNYFHIINQFHIDFDTINANLKANTYLNMVIELDNEKIEYEFKIRGKSSGRVCGSTENVNYIYRDYTPVYDDENGMVYYNDIMAYKDAEFIIRNTNITDSVAVLYQYDSENRCLVEYTQMSTDEMKKTSGEGNSYDYYITFENVEPDKIYYMIFDENYESEFVYITDEAEIYIEQNESIMVVEDEDYYYFQYLNADLINNKLEVYYTDDYGNKKIIPSYVEIYNETEGDLTLDFSSVEKFVNMTLYIKYKNEIMGSYSAFDCRSDTYSNVWCDMYYEEDCSYIQIYGQNIDKISNPTLKFSKTEKSGVHYVQGEEVLSLPIDITDKNHIIYDTDLIELPDGRYCVYLCEGDNKITYFTELYINKNVKSSPVIQKKTEINDDFLKITLYNDSYRKYDKATMIVVARDENGAIIKISLETINIMPYENNIYELPAVEGAKDYRVFVLENKTSLRPLMKL